MSSVGLNAYRILSQNAAIRVSPFQLGTMSLGAAWSAFMSSANKEDSFKFLDAYIEKGGNFIDTASNYQDGNSEKFIGEWMATKGIRDHIVLATKYTLPYKLHETGPGTGINYSGNSRRNLYTSVRDSLQKLQTDYIDILYLHIWDWSASIPEVMDSLHNLVMQNKVLYLGISDTPAWIVSACNEYAKAQGKTPFSIYQGKWSVIDRDFERDIIPMARHYGMALAPWGALGSGRFQTKKQKSDREAKGDKMRPGLPGAADRTSEEAAASEALEKVAKELGSVSITAVALAYLLHKCPDVPVFPILGGRRVEQLEDNLGALDIRLSKKQMEALEGAKEFDIGFPTDFVGENARITNETMGMIAPAGDIEWRQRPGPMD